MARTRDWPAKEIRRQFPTIIRSRREGFTYLDSGATTHPARIAEDTIKRVQRRRANVHRGIGEFSQTTSRFFDRTRGTARRFIGGEKEGNYTIFVNNNTHGINLAAHMMEGVAGKVLVSGMEHHSNDLPYRMRGDIGFFNVDKAGRIDMADLKRKLSRGGVKLVAVAGASNVTGFMPDIHAIARLAHEYGAKILVDAAQLAAHAPIDVKPNADPAHIDFLVFGGHKMYNPSGGGILFAPSALSDAAAPFMPGGGTVTAVTRRKVYYVNGPERHEGGTQDIDAIAGGLRGVLVGLKMVGLENVRAHEKMLTHRLMTKLRAVPGVTIYGDFSEEERVGAVSFNVNGMDYAQLAGKLSRAKIQVRDGCFCAHPHVNKLLGMPAAQSERLARDLDAGKPVRKPGMVRVSIAIHTTPREIDRFVSAVRQIVQVESAAASGS